MPSTRFVVALFAAATLALTGCTASGPGGDELTYEDSPLSKYLTAIYSGELGPDATPQEQQEYYNEQNRRVEELVAQCMTKEGFEYVPNTSNTSVVISDGDDENMWRPDDRDWVEKYGYGAVNNPWQERSESQQPDVSEPQTDPNQEYVESLTEAEQQAYYEALWGKQEVDPDADPNEPQDWNWETAGCYGAAQHEVQGDNPWDQAENKPIMDAIQRFYETLASLPDLAKLDSEWSACMTEAGFSGFPTQQEAQNSIYELINKYWENAPQGDGEWDPNFGTTKDPEFAKIAEQEIPLALADLTCREKTDYRQQQLRIQFAAEEQFIADNKEALDAMLARAEQRQK